MGILAHDVIKAFDIKIRPWCKLRHDFYNNLCYSGKSDKGTGTCLVLLHQTSPCPLA